VKGQRLDVSPCSSTFEYAFVVPLLPQPGGGEQICKLIA
jgi:hypothetical protein